MLEGECMLDSTSAFLPKCVKKAPDDNGFVERGATPIQFKLTLPGVYAPIAAKMFEQIKKDYEGRLISRDQLKSQRDG